jgi:hypothetical protein
MPPDDSNVMVNAPEPGVRASPSPNAGLAQKVRRVLCSVTCFAVAAFGAVTFAQAWSLTHYAPTGARTTRLSQLSFTGKIRTVICGPTVRRQMNVKTPADVGLRFETSRFRGAEVWRIAPKGSSPTVLMFPGYGASKDTLLGAAKEFADLGLGLWLVDPRGVGGSEGG